MNGSSGPDESDLLSSDLKRVIELAVASVVFIVRFERVRGEVDWRSSGSGFCWANVNGETLIVTNRHVVSEESDSTFSVSFGEKGGSRYSAELVGRHPLADIAVLRAAMAPKPAILSFRKSGIWPGEDVIAVGNPHGYTTSFSRGIVSATDRENFFGPGGRPVRALQTDAAINSGNSGGPLLGVDGSVVGVNAHGDAKVTSPWPVQELDSEGQLEHFESDRGTLLAVQPMLAIEGVNFAVPADIAEAAVAAVVEADGGPVATGYLGITYDREFWYHDPGQTVDTSVKRIIAGSVGVQLSEDPPSESPASRAGLRRGDEIVSINDEPVDHPADLNAWAIKRVSWEQEVPLRFVREGRMMEVQVRGDRRSSHQ